MAEIYLYNTIYDFVAEGLISQINDYMGRPIFLRANSSGGEVEAAYGVAAKISEHGDVTIKVDGCADSMMANILLYAKSVECLDVSTFTLHRAAYPDWVNPTPAQNKNLEKINADLKSKMLKRIDSTQFLAVTGYTIDQMFDPEQRIDITINAKQAKQIGLVQKVNVLTPAEVEAFNNKMAIAAELPKENSQKMDINKLKSEHPEIYNQVFDLGVKAEKGRVEACMVYMEIDPTGVKAAIESGENLSPKAMAEFNLKAVSNNSLKELEAGNTKPVATGEALKVEDEKKATIEAWRESVHKQLKLS